MACALASWRGVGCVETKTCQRGPPVSDTRKGWVGVVLGGWVGPRGLGPTEPKQCKAEFWKIG